MPKKSVIGRDQVEERANRATSRERRACVRIELNGRMIEDGDRDRRIISEETPEDVKSETDHDDARHPEK